MREGGEGAQMKGSRAMRRAALAPLFLLIGAGDVQLSPGLWEVRNTPGVATLDGKVLDDLPLGEIKTQRICLAASEAADPVAFFARDTKENCRVTSGNAAAGKVAIAGVCPNPEEGTEGTMKFEGRYAGDSYALDFATTATDFQGVMTFSGTLTGRRVGPCPPA
jgi:hypothetical protein